MDVEAGVVQNGTLKPESTPNRLLRIHSSTVETFINIHIWMFILQAIISSYETPQHTAQKMFWDSLPWVILTIFAFLCKKMYRISKNKGIFELLELYRHNKDYIKVVVACYTSMLASIVVLVASAYQNRDNPMKVGRSFFSLFCMLVFLWCVKELYHEEEEKKRKTLIIASSSMTASIIADAAFGVAYLRSSGNLSIAGVISTPFFVVVWICTYRFHQLDEQSRSRIPGG